jgi:hypothetical protein
MHRRNGRDVQIHHAMGRVGRLKACAHFLYPLSRKEHESAKTLKELRDWNREDFLEMQKANKDNKDQTTCLWTACAHYYRCALAQRGKDA